MSADAQDRNLPATERRIQRARTDGQVPRSRELSHLLALGLGGAALVAAATPLATALRQGLAQGLQFDVQHVQRPAAMLERLADGGLWLVAVTVPLGLLGMLLAVLAALISGGWNFTLKPLVPKLSKVNPIEGLGRMVSMAQLGDMLKSCALALSLTVIATLYLRAHWAQFQEAAGMLPSQAISSLVDVGVSGLGLLLVAIAVFAALDLPLQRFLLARRLRMSREEMRQEYKEVEGNAEIKGRLRSRMREIAKRRMMAAVPTADLVVMNPSHFAVALKYDDGSMAAPRVVAKGADLLAFRIRELAESSKVPVLRMPPLARALYAHAEVDQEIPAALFAAVAQVLAYVYQLRAALAGEGPMPAEPIEPDVPAELDPLHATATDAPARNAQGEPS